VIGAEAAGSGFVYDLSIASGGLSETLSELEQFLNVFIPTEISRPRNPHFMHGRGLFCRSRCLHDPLCQKFRREAREIKRSIPADLAVHSYVGRDHRKTAGHRLNQRVSKGLSVGGSHIKIARSIKAMQ
jgi:hypothetical protein